MASGSTKELFRSLQTFFGSPASAKAVQGIYTSEELPENVLQSIQSYLQRHTSLEENDSDRLHEELLSIYKKNVSRDKGKLAAFLQSLCLFCPLIRRKSRLDVWWETVISGVIDGGGHKTIEIQYTTEFLLSVLDYSLAGDKSEEAGRIKISNHFTTLLLEAYLRRTKAPDSDARHLSLEDELVAKQLEGVLVAFGRKKPRNFLVAVDDVLVQRDHRMQALGLLSTFVRRQPPHLHVVTETSLIEHLLKSLMIDTSTTVISLALACLIMFLPHIPMSVKEHLPRLFLIYSRLLCWERFAPSLVDGTAEVDTNYPTLEPGEHQPSPADAEDWTKLHSSFDTAESTAPELLHYFTFLYGLYPLNFLAYIRKPRRYLKDINFPRAVEFDLDQAVIRTRTEQFRRVHLMHPNFYQATVEEELTDNRWLKSDPADVVAECMSLCVTAPELPSSKFTSDPTLSFPEIPSHLLHENDIPHQSLLDESENSAPLNKAVENLKPDNLAVPPTSCALPGLRALNSSVGSPSTQSFAASSPLTHAVDAAPDSPTLPRPPFASNTLREVSMGRHDSSWSLPSTSNLSPKVGPVSRSHMPRSPAIKPAPASEANIAFLQREVMLLRSDLNFERYLKQQHLSHIGQLQRRQIKEATIEAETQNLINTNRALKGQLAKANEAYGSLKRETATGRNQAKKLEAELSTRVRTLREDEKQWRAEEQSLRGELNKARLDSDHLRQLVVDSESRELLAKQELSFTEVRLERMDEFKNRVAQLEKSVRDYESKEMIHASAKSDRDALRLELAAANLMIQSLNSNSPRENTMLQSKDSELISSSS